MDQECVTYEEFEAISHEKIVSQLIDRKYGPVLNYFGHADVYYIVLRVFQSSLICPVACENKSHGDI